MEKNKTCTEIIARDYYGDNFLNDSCNTLRRQKCRNQRGPQGEVHVYEEKDGKKELVHKGNIVVYRGREMLAQRLVDTTNVNIISGPSNKEFVGWLGLGEGGVDPADPLDPVPPASQDNDLVSPIMINDSTSAGYGDYRLVGGSNPKTGFYKKLFDTVEFERDSFNDDRWLVIKTTTTIGLNDANGEQFNEAGLYSASSRAAGYSGNFSLFARVTFPSVIKTQDRRLVLVWYLYV